MITNIKSTAIAACLLLSACAGTANITNHGGNKEIFYSGFSDAPPTPANQYAMQHFANEQCPNGYSIVSQSQKLSIPFNIKWVIRCTNATP